MIDTKLEVANIAVYKEKIFVNSTGVAFRIVTPLKAWHVLQSLGCKEDIVSAQLASVIFIFMPKGSMSCIVKQVGVAYFCPRRGLFPGIHHIIFDGGRTEQNEHVMAVPRL